MRSLWILENLLVDLLIASWTYMRVSVWGSPIKWVTANSKRYALKAWVGEWFFLVFFLAAMVIYLSELGSITFFFNYNYIFQFGFNDNWITSIKIMMHKGAYIPITHEKGVCHQVFTTAPIDLLNKLMILLTKYLNYSLKKTYNILVSLCRSFKYN